MPVDQLSPQRQAFVSHYLTNGYNALQAAISAGYSPASARNQGQRLMKIDAVQRAIQRKQATLTVQTDYSHSLWLRDALEMVDEARKRGSYSAAFKGHELIGRHIGALRSEKKLSAEEAKGFTWLGAAMQKHFDEEERARRSVSQLSPASDSEG